MSLLKSDIITLPQEQQRFQYDEEVFINYEKIGAGDISLILLHGFGLSLYSWSEVKNKIADTRYTLFLLDLKGFGFSYKGEKGTYSLEEQAEILASFIKAKALKEVILIGHSYGGMVALNMLYLNKSKELNIAVQKLILIDTPAFPNTQPLFLKFLRNPILNFISLNLISSRTNAKITIRNTFYNFEKGIEKFLSTYEFFFKLPGAKRAMTIAAQNIYPKDPQKLIHYYSLINIPILIIWGENDKLIPLSNGEALKKILPNAKLVTIDECGHVPNEEQPYITANHISAFLNH